MNIDHLVDKYVVRDDCPAEPCASESLIKWRAVAVGVIGASPGLLISPVYPPLGIALAFVGLYVTVKRVGGRINELIELDGHTCEEGSA